MKRLYTGLTEAGNVTFVWRIQVTKRGIEVPGCGCGRDMKTELLKSIFITSMNAHDRCLENETEIKHSSLFQ